MTPHLWTWTGIDFGDHAGDELWTHDGRHVGRFYGDLVYASDGGYLGELKHDDRLIIDTRKRARHRSTFTPLPDRPPRAAFVGFGGFAMRPDWRDFPRPEAL
jgi:hypothetical protein